MKQNPEALGFETDLLGLIFSDATGGVSDVIADVVGTQVKQSVREFNAKLQRWADDPSLWGMKVITTVSRMYDGYGASVDFQPWK